MYTKEEVRQFKTDFWTSFGVYMKKHNKTFGVKINWVNYKTKIKDVYFRLNATNKKATFAIEIQHKDAEIRELFYEQFVELKTVLNTTFKNKLTWELTAVNDFKIEISKIGCVKTNTNIFDKNTWGETFAFFEQNMLNIHEFWTDFNEVFKQLE